MNIPHKGKLIVSIIICELAGIIGSFFTSSAIPTWYATLEKPFFSPPNWLFGPVWVLLYALMGIAAYLIWRNGIRGPEGKSARIALGIFCVQLILNTSWSIIFFGMQNPGAAFIEIILLWIAILATMIAFYKISKPAMYLLIPYIAWVSFAACLNYAIWMRN